MMMVVLAVLEKKTTEFIWRASLQYTIHHCDNAAGTAAFVIC